MKKIIKFLKGLAAKIFGKEATWLKSAINVTQIIKNALTSGVADFVVNITKTDLDNKILDKAKKYIVILLAEELLIQDAAAATTEEDAKAIAKQIVDQFGKLSDEKKEEFYTSVAAKIYIFIKQHANGEKITFGQAAQLVEAAYQEWIASKA